jgi:hypothetical protein
MACANLIRPLVSADVDPRHVEAWIRSEHGTLDHLSRRQFELEVSAAVACIARGGTKMSEMLARSYGL